MTDPLPPRPLRPAPSRGAAPCPGSSRWRSPPSSARCCSPAATSPAAGGGGSGCAAPDEAFAALCEAYDRLQREYVDELDPDKLAEGAIRGMFQYGVEDPYSGYMPPEQYQQALGDLSGSFSGIGAEMAISNIEDPADLAACTEFNSTCRLVVVAPLADSPAEPPACRRETSSWPSTASRSTARRWTTRSAGSAASLGPM